MEFVPLFFMYKDNPLETGNCDDTYYVLFTLFIISNEKNISRFTEANASELLENIHAW